MIHLPFLVGELTGAIARSGVHHRRRHDFRIAGIACLVEEEVNQRALQAGTPSFVNREACARYLHTQVEVYQVVFLSQLPVRQGILRQLSLHAAHLFHHIVCGSCALRHFFIRDIGDGIEQRLHVFGSLVHLGLQRLAGFFYLGYVLFRSFGFLFLAFLHQHTDGFRQGVHLREVLI